MKQNKKQRAESTPEQKYDLDIALQRRILKLLLTDRTSMANYRTLVKPEFFEDPHDILVCSLAYSYFDKFNILPSRRILLQEAKRVIKSEGLQTNLKLVKMNYRAVMHEPLTDMEYLREHVVKFAEDQALKDFILQGSELALAGKSRQLRKMLDDAMNISAHLKELGMLYFDNDAIRKRIERRKSGVRSDAIPSGIQGLDKQIKGACPGELWCFLAPPRGGKSTSLLNVGVGALLAGKTVFHYTLELSEDKIADRYDANLLKCPKKRLNEIPKTLRRRLRKLYHQIKAQMVIKYFPAGINLLTIQGHMKHMESAKGLRPDVVIIDYADYMAPIQFTKYGNEWADVGQVYKDLFAFAGQMKIPIWTASLTNRAGSQKKVITINDFGKSFEKAAICDGVIAICQTEDEEKQRKARYFTAKVRDEEDHKIIYVNMDKRRMLVTWDEERQVEDYEY